MYPHVFGISSWALFLIVGLSLGLFGATSEIIHRKAIEYEVYVAGIVFSVFVGFLFTGFVTTFLLKIGERSQLHFSFITGFLGGFISFCAWFRKYKIFLLMNITAPYLAFAHAFGRLGCLFYGCCFGYPSVTYGVPFLPGSPAAMKLGGVPFLFPIQAIESAFLFFTLICFFYKIVA